MAHFAGRREIGKNFPMRAASVDPKNTQHTPLTRINASPRQKSALRQGASCFFVFSFTTQHDAQRTPALTGPILSVAVIDIGVGKNQWSACQNLEKNYARARSTFPKLEKPARKVDGEAAHFWYFFKLLEGWNALGHSFSRGFRTLAINSFRRQ